jgi:rhodanese-related sulfurtransferase
MTMGIKDLVAEARAEIDAMSPQAAHEAAAGGDLILDVREPGELSSDGRIAGALHLPRGVLEAKADPDSPAAEKDLTRHRGQGRVHVLCASGARAALAAHTLTRMGYEATIIEGGLKAWKDGGLPVD